MLVENKGLIKMFNVIKPTIEQQFRIFHAENPHFYELVKQFTFQLIDKGYKNCSMDMIFNRVRWETHIETYDPSEGFKCSNNYTAHYARMFMEDFPEHKGFFRTRCITGESEQERVELYTTGE